MDSCPKCKVELAVYNGGYMEGEDGKIYRVLFQRCRNPKCTDYNETVNTIRQEIPITLTEINGEIQEI